jgi:hypothetical protein
MEHNEHVIERSRYRHHKIEESDTAAYPALGVTVAKLRKRAADICIVHRAVARREHGLAVLEAIRKLNYQALKRELPSHNVDCASGTNHNDGAAILKALRVQHRNHCNPDTIRTKRSIEAIESAYEAAMADKRKRLVVS